MRLLMVLFSKDNFDFLLGLWKNINCEIAILSNSLVG